MFLSAHAALFLLRYVFVSLWQFITWNLCLSGDFVAAVFEDLQRIHRQTLFRVSKCLSGARHTQIPLLNCTLCFRYGKGSFSFSNLVSGITKRFSTEFELQEVCSAHSHYQTNGCSLWVFGGNEMWTDSEIQFFVSFSSWRNSKKTTSMLGLAQPPWPWSRP